RGGGRLVPRGTAARDLHGRADREYRDPGLERGPRRAALAVRRERGGERRRCGDDLHAGGRRRPRATGHDRRRRGGARADAGDGAPARLRGRGLQAGNGRPAEQGREGGRGRGRSDGRARGETKQGRRDRGERARPRGRARAAVVGVQGRVPVRAGPALHGASAEGAPGTTKGGNDMTTEARRVVTVERGTEWEDGFARPRVMLQPYAAPSVLGLYGFAAATFMVALHLTGVYGGATTNATLWPFAALFGGVAQFMAGMWAFRVRDTIATAMHGMWGSFWIAFGILNLLIMWGKLPDHPAGSVSDPQFAMWFWTLGAITAAGALAAVAE